MYTIKFNSCTISTFDKEEQAIAIALNLHNVSNIPHNIIVLKEGQEILIFNRYVEAGSSQS